MITLRTHLYRLLLRLAAWVNPSPVLHARAISAAQRGCSAREVDALLSRSLAVGRRR